MNPSWFVGLLQCGWVNLTSSISLPQATNHRLYDYIYIYSPSPRKNVFYIVFHCFILFYPILFHVCSILFRWPKTPRPGRGQPNAAQYRDLCYLDVTRVRMWQVSFVSFLRIWSGGFHKWYTMMVYNHMQLGVPLFQKTSIWVKHHATILE
jgi:hypothetical protein